MSQSRVIAVAWRNDQPPLGSVVEVSYLNSTILAYHDGQGWRAVDGARLPNITYWRPRGTVAQLRRVLPQ